MIPGLYKSFQDKWANYQTVWVISDTHFNDGDLAAGIERPSADEMVRLINSKVGKRDILIHLGDVGDIEYAKRLRGYKILIMGNHDAGASNYEGIFDEIYEGALIIGEKLILSHEPINMPCFFNLHGHIHDCRAKNDKHHKNFCSDVIGYIPVNFNQLMKSGPTANIQSIHRETINKATKRKERRKNDI